MLLLLDRIRSCHHPQRGVYTYDCMKNVQSITGENVGVEFVVRMYVQCHFRLENVKIWEFSSYVRSLSNEYIPSPSLSKTYCKNEWEKAGSHIFLILLGSIHSGSEWMMLESNLSGKTRIRTTHQRLKAFLGILEFIGTMYVSRILLNKWENFRKVAESTEMAG